MPFLEPDRAGEPLADTDRWRATGRRGVPVRVVDGEDCGPAGPGAAMAVSEE